MRHLILDKHNEVVNVIVWEGAEFLPPRGHTVMRSDHGELYDWWHAEHKMFVTQLGKKRIYKNNKTGEEELDEALKKELQEAEFGPFHPEYSAEKDVF